MSKHTPGPWQYLGDPEDGECRVRQTASVREGAGFVSEVTICQEINTYGNARLIAQAPRMFDLLKEARRTLEMWKDVAPAVSLCADIDKALAEAGAE